MTGLSMGNNKTPQSLAQNCVVDWSNKKDVGIAIYYKKMNGGLYIIRIKELNDEQ